MQRQELEQEMVRLRRKLQDRRKQLASNSNIDIIDPIQSEHLLSFNFPLNVHYVRRLTFEDSNRGRTQGRNQEINTDNTRSVFIEGIPGSIEYHAMRKYLSEPGKIAKLDYQGNAEWTQRYAKVTYAIDN